VRKVVVSTLVAGSLALGAASANGEKVAHGAQKAAIVRAAFGSKPPVGCYKAYVSSVDHRYASASYGGSVAGRCVQWGSNGIVIEHYRRGRWHVVTEGSAYRCPIRGVPNRVERDLIPAPKCF
jgi:hypothetical protein